MTRHCRAINSWRGTRRHRVRLLSVVLFGLLVGIWTTREASSQPRPASESAAGAAEAKSEPAASPTKHDQAEAVKPSKDKHATAAVDYWSLLFVLALATFVGLGVIGRVSRLLHTPLMSLTNAISAIAVVGSLVVTGAADYPIGIRIVGFVALVASMTNIVSGFLITDRMLKMFKQPGAEERGGIWSRLGRRIRELIQRPGGGGKP